MNKNFPSSNSAKISGFTIIKNGLSLNYPFVESIKSITPLCDEIIIIVGFEDEELTFDDGTYNLLKKEFPDKKFLVKKTYWPKKHFEKGKILANKTNLALKFCQFPFCFYIQGDEVIHEQDYPIIRSSISDLSKSSKAEGLLFNFIHFYGNVDIYKYTRNVYRREIRIFKNRRGIKSWKDAQGFRTKDDQKISCLLSKARIFHYGWARKEQIMRRKIKAMDLFYHRDEGNKFSNEKVEFKYRREWGLRKFIDGHPKVMENWIEANKNPINVLNEKIFFDFRTFGLMLSDIIERFTGLRVGEYKNYKLVKG